MYKHQVIIADKHYVSSAQNLNSCFYVGKDYATFSSIKNCGVRSFVEFYDNALDEVKNTIVNLDAYFDDLMLYLSDTTCYNKYATPMIDYMVKAKIISDLVKNHESLILIVDTNEEIKIFKKFLTLNGHSCKIIIKNSILNIDYLRYLRIIKHQLSAISYDIQKIITLKKIRNTYKNPLNLVFKDQTNQEFCLVTWINSQSFEQDLFWKNNNYFGDLPYMLQKNTTVRVLGKIIYGDRDFKQIFKKAILAYPEIKFMEDYMTIMDVIKANLMRFKIIRHLNKPLIIDGINFSSIIRGSLFNDLIGHRFSNTILDYKVFKKFLVSCKGQVKILYPFENQPWERAMLLAKQTYTNVVCMAYQFFPIPSNLLIQNFSKQAVKNNLLPFKLYVSDNINYKAFTQQGLNVYPLGSFRYKKFLETESLCGNNFDKQVILCSTFLDNGESQELALKAAEATKNTTFTLWINFHPLLSKEVKNNIKILLEPYKHVKIYDQNILSLLSQVGLVFYNSSSVCYDSILNGIPCVYIKSDLQFNLNRFPLPNNIKNFSDPKNGQMIIQEIFSTKNTYIEYTKNLFEIIKSTLIHTNNEAMESVL